MIAMYGLVSGDSRGVWSVWRGATLQLSLSLRAQGEGLKRLGGRGVPSWLLVGTRKTEVL